MDKINVGKGWQPVKLANRIVVDRMEITKECVGNRIIKLQEAVDATDSDADACALYADFVERLKECIVFKGGKDGLHVEAINTRGVTPGGGVEV